MVLAMVLLLRGDVRVTRSGATLGGRRTGPMRLGGRLARALGLQRHSIALLSARLVMCHPPQPLQS